MGYDSEYAVTCEGCDYHFYSDVEFLSPRYCDACRMLFEDGKREGRREVVREIDLSMLAEWIERCGATLKDDNMSNALAVDGLQNIVRYLASLQAKLRE